jgi:mannose-6-phosphate isomerase-like protein (cupin superfamily)
VVDIEKLTLDNSRFRASWWTGKFLQMTVMSIPPGGEIGLEKHDVGDQFIRVEQGRARVVMGPSEDQLTYKREVGDDWAIFIPAGAWHNIINVGKEDLKVYVIYAPPEHPAGTLHETFEESEADHAE